MVKKFYLFTACIISISLYSCSKKTTPGSTATTTSAENAKTISGKSAEPGKVVMPVNPDSVVVKKVVPKPKPKPAPIPKVIVVNDAGAKKAIDGRLYYDMQGRRYWRNNKDGKYYLYNKSMQTDEAFKAPAKKS
jgi:hypothetical protein